LFRGIDAALLETGIKKANNPSVEAMKNQLLQNLKGCTVRRNILASSEVDVVVEC
jgi:hypothetical protein